jgi:hypothetical protein
LSDGFHLNSGLKVGGDGRYLGEERGWEGGCGVLLVGGEAFGWKPWLGEGKGNEERNLVNEKGQFEVGDEAWGVLGVVWPRPGMFLLFFLLSFPSNFYLLQYFLRSSTLQIYDSQKINN